MASSHLQVFEAVPRVTYAGNGLETAFPVPFSFFEAGHVWVYLNDSRQTSGFTVTGAGQSDGGVVTFDAAPAAGVSVTLTRRLPYARTSDFLEAGPFGANALNSELDALAMQVQQLAGDLALILKEAETEGNTGAMVLPSRVARANRALAFDGDGALTVVPHGESLSPPDYVPGGLGGITRTMQDKLAENVSVKDFGAKGTGLVDDTLAFQAALAAAATVFVPAGTYLVSSTLELGEGQRLYGVGQASIVKATREDIDLVRFPAAYAELSHVRLEGGAVGVRLYGRDGPCVQNTLSDVVIWRAGTGIILDGYTDTNKPCYWNNFDRVLVVKPRAHGLHMMRSGAGDSPNANRFSKLRIYSLAEPTSGVGIWVESGRYKNAFIDCEVNLHTTAQYCVRVGPDCEKTLFINLYTETLAAIDNIWMEAGSTETSIINLLSASAGKAIKDDSGGSYIALNAGYPDKHRLNATRITDLTVEQLRYETRFIDADEEATVPVDLTCSCNLVGAANGAITMELPTALNAAGAQVTIKKIDNSSFPVIIAEAEDGPGPDGRTLTLSAQYDHVTLVSNGAGWWILSGTVTPFATWYSETAGTITPDILRPLNLISAYAGDVEVRLPPADGFDAPGREVTIKRADDNGAHTLTVTEHGATGPDDRVWSLGAKGDFVTVVCDGSGWWVTSSNIMPESAAYTETPGLYQPDLTRRLYMVSAYGGDVEMRLPAAWDSRAVGRCFTVKRVDSSENSLTITEEGRNGPDNEVIPLTGIGHALTVMSDGSYWRILSRHM